MILLTLLLITLIILTIVTALFVTVGGAMAVVLFGDVFVCILIIVLIVKRLIKGKKK